MFFTKGSIFAAFLRIMPILANLSSDFGTNKASTVDGYYNKDTLV